jgi:hypothetical protein
VSIYLFGIRIIISIYVLSGTFNPSQEKIEIYFFEC